MSAPAPVVERLEIPDALLYCKAEPPPPQRSSPGQPRSQVEIGGWIIDVLDAGADCRSKLERVRQIQRDRMVADKEGD